MSFQNRMGYCHFDVHICSINDASISREKFLEIRFSNSRVDRAYFWTSDTIRPKYWCIEAIDCSLPVGSEIVKPAPVVRDLGVLLDANLSMKQHISKVAATCYYQLRRLRQIRRRVGPEVTTQQSTVEPLQRVQNAAARLIFNLGRHERTTLCLFQLHWLPVRFRTVYKLCVLMHNIWADKSPRYLSDIVQPTTVTETRFGLRSSSDTSSYTTPRLRTKFRECAFSFSRPAAWNSLPADLRTISSITDFKTKLKHHLFRLAFDIL